MAACETLGRPRDVRDRRGERNRSDGREELLGACDLIGAAQDVAQKHCGGGGGGRGQKVLERLFLF